ncbi:AhpC/TSA antioxidant enzyme-domain-containing protein [Gymnopilus junonius]|uniref:AhpC/TSA antioxidant enzyme-domain-containing protein n=1 Tax=Gymnopilus junonius TaxID=109634 RepID=A0A9P5TMN2_GYMJU|nr:AhpC/TSA antioxidant enzyme-domain-containing protein [Gymnopilus junonius]
MKDFKAIPDEKTIQRASELNVLDVNGENVEFGSLFKDEKTVVVFIRHFFCGQYVEALAAVPHKLLSRGATSIVVIGCGDYQPIANYAASTNFFGPIYTDPTRQLYKVLGMDVENLEKTPASQEKKSYLTLSTARNLAMSLWRGPIKHPSLIGKNGDISQLGGEFVFGPGNTCSFASRMQHTEDHVEVADLMSAVGIDCLLSQCSDSFSRISACILKMTSLFEISCSTVLVNGCLISFVSKL